ncbi:Enterobactin exporter EntS [Pseudomonas fluorescens]|uniref:MFS transporter n=1 Tax=Pseudomonas fluorescens TaxID=294 RepID=UPI001240865F|nr:MFS transporter [Pseudomonas fluorescens]VVN70546.1 Enterobactin exporter EntS [Pseudomonas fluorescens]
MLNNAVTLGVFRHRTFRVLWLCSLVSNIGALIQLVAAAWLMTILSSSEGMVTLVQASVTLPIMLTALMAGVLADSFDRRKIMLVAQAFMMVVSILMACLAFENLLSPWSLLAFTFLIGIGTALHYPSWQASLREMVPREDLTSAVSVNAMGMNITRSLGPAIGGLIVAMVSPAAALAVNALTYSAIIIALIKWKPTVTCRQLPRERFHSAFAAGLRFFFMSPDLMVGTFRGCIFGFAAISMQALSPLIARKLLGGDATLYGVLLGAFGFGAVVGALMLGRLREALHNEIICRIGFLLFSACCLVVAFSTNTLITVLAMFVAGFCWLSVVSLINVIVQLSTPNWVLGRILALYMTGLFGGMAAGSWVLGEISETYSISTAFIVASAILIFGTTLGIRWPLSQRVDKNLNPLNQFNEPAIRLDLNRRSGPIMIMIEYTIDEDDVVNFLETMAECRRVRVRDGARHWSLLRDLENPELWIETYHFPTWTEYKRHHERKTFSDSEVTERLKAFHRGNKPLRAHRMIERQTVTAEDDTPRITTKIEVIH